MMVYGPGAVFFHVSGRCLVCCVSSWIGVAETGEHDAENEGVTYVQMEFARAGLSSCEKNRS
jgi:hypothetical protein